MAQLPPYTTTGERVWHYSFRVICGLIFLFLILPVLIVLPLSFNEPYFSFTPGMLAFDPEAYSLTALVQGHLPQWHGGARRAAEPCMVRRHLE